MVVNEAVWPLRQNLIFSPLSLAVTAFLEVTVDTADIRDFINRSVEQAASSLSSFHLPHHPAKSENISYGDKNTVLKEAPKKEISSLIQALTQ